MHTNALVRMARDALRIMVLAFARKAGVVRTVLRACVQSGSGGPNAKKHANVPKKIQKCKLFVSTVDSMP